MPLTVIPIKTQKKTESFDLISELFESLKENHVTLENGDVIVISSKFVSFSQGRLVTLDTIAESDEAKTLGKKYNMNPKIAEIVIRESDKILGGISGFVISASDDIIAPNAGIDKSNAKKGQIILYPKNPYQVAEEIRRKIFLKMQIHVGVIIVDSRLMPSRVGTTGVAIACAGLEPVEDLRGQKDLDGNPLKVTFQAVVDNLASIANHKMGEGSDSKPFALVRDSGARLTDRKINPNEVAISHDQCVYIRGLKPE